MIVLDTNVISELMRERPEPKVLQWADAQATGTLWSCAITLFELHFGLQRMAVGKRRNLLESRLVYFEANILAGRVLDFDSGAARAAARYSAALEVRGTPVDMRDVQIAGIVLRAKAKLATRNVKYFTALKGFVVNPWLD